jgi:lysophospholipase L1-like esterase
MGRQLLLSIAALLLGLLGLEVAIRLYDVAHGREFLSGPVIKPHRLFGSDVYSADEDGPSIRSRHGEPFTFDKASGVTRIVTFGGSTSVNKAVFVEHGLHYSSVLQTQLKQRFPDKAFEVITVANEAYTIPHSITLLAFDVLSWDPDIVILSHNFNDLNASYFPGFRPDYSNKLSHAYYNMTWRKYTCQMLRLCRFVSARLRASGLNGHPVRRASYGTQPPAIAQDVFERNLRSFAALARENGIRVILGSQPLERIEQADFDLDMGVKPYNDVVTYPLHDEFVSHHKTFNEIIAMTANRMGVTYVDNHEIFDGDPTYFKDFIHYSRAGVELLASNYENAIASMLDVGGRLSAGSRAVGD